MKVKQLEALIEMRGGYLLLHEAQNLGISKTYVQQYIKFNGLERIAHGLYKTPDVWTDDLYIFALKNEKLVYSFDTALMLHGLTEREPAEIFVNVPKNYNASHLRSKGIVVCQVKEEWMELGKTSVKTIYGNNVPVYDMERTICDILRVKEKKDPQMFVYAIKEYAKSANKNLPRLMKYAKEFGLEAILHQYMEVLL